MKEMYTFLILTKNRNYPARIAEQGRSSQQSGLMYRKLETLGLYLPFNKVEMT